MVRRMYGSLVLCTVCLAGACASAGPVDEAIATARRWRVENERQILEEYVRFLKIPNFSRDARNIRRNADHLLGLLEKRGLAARLIEAPGASPLVYGELLTPGATATYVFYAHYDGQFADSGEWTSPPFEPTLRSASLEQGGKVLSLQDVRPPYDPEWRIYARSAADDKAPIVAMLAAHDALRAAGISPKANIKFVFDGEEEMGSPNLGRLLASHKDALRGDLWIICDGPQHRSGRPTVVFGVRGIQVLEITVYGPNKDLHSGRYGNWAPNPAIMLSRLLSSMRDEDGHILIEGFYDDVAPISDGEQAAIAAIPDDDAGQMRSLAIARTEGGGKRLPELVMLPALNIRGLSSGRTGFQAVSSIPSTATATMDIRLVKGMDVSKTAAALKRHIERQGYFLTESEPDENTLRAHPKVARLTIRAGGYNATRTRMDLPAAQKVIASLEKVRSPLHLEPSIGGSLPLSVIEETVQSPTLTVSTVNHDNNQHAGDENLRLGNLWEAIDSMAAMLVMD